MQNIRSLAKPLLAPTDNVIELLCLARDRSAATHRVDAETVAERRIANAQLELVRGQEGLGRVREQHGLLQRRQTVQVGLALLSFFGRAQNSVRNNSAEDCFGENVLNKSASQTASHILEVSCVELP